MKFCIAFLAIFTCPSIHAERIPRHQLPAGWPWDTIPHVADGASWKTSLILTNMESVPSRYKVDFFGDDGKPKAFRITGRGNVNSVNGTIPVGGTVTLETEGTGGVLHRGWATLDIVGTDAVSIMVIFGTSNFEATVTASTGIDHACILPFDNTRGYVTSTAILNPSEFSTSDMPVTIYDENGTILVRETLRLPPGTKIAFATPERWPHVTGKRGAVHFDGVLQSFAVLGLRFNPGGGFTTVNVMDK